MTCDRPAWSDEEIQMEGFTPWRSGVEGSNLQAMTTNTHTKTNPMKTNLSQLLTKASMIISAAALLTATCGFAAEKDTLNAAEVKFLKHEAAVGMATLKVAELAVSKASRADVKTFAETLVKDHTSVNAQLVKLAATKGVDLSATINPDEAEAFQDLEKGTGAEFDKDFLAWIDDRHTKCVSNFEAAIKDGKDVEVKTFAQATLPALQAHLAAGKALTAKDVSLR